MNHLEDDTRFYVYVHKDKITGEICYVGSGSGNRYRSIESRSSEHKEIWPNLDKTILVSEMSREDALKYENLLLAKLLPSGNLLNKYKEVYTVNHVNYTTLSEYFEYDITSPTFLRWIKQPIKTDGTPLGIVKVGQVAGWFCKRTGYVNLKFLGTTFRGHRVVYSLCTGADVPRNLVIDHIDNNRANNNISNLRLVSFLENNRNSQKYSSNTTGVTGVSWMKSKAGGNWVAYYNVDFTRRTKNFNPRILYPDLSDEESKQRAFEDAVAYRQEMEALYYNLPDKGQT